jgi:hypothetical protein
MEMVGEYLGLDTDQGIFTFFRRYQRREFPALAPIHRTTFARQAANLWQPRSSCAATCWTEALGPA